MAHQGAGVNMWTTHHRLKKDARLTPKPPNNSAKTTLKHKKTTSFCRFKPYLQNKSARCALALNLQKIFHAIQTCWLRMQPQRRAHRPRGKNPTVKRMVGEANLLVASREH